MRARIVAVMLASATVAHAEPIMVVPAGAPVEANVQEAVMRGARRVSAEVTVGSASLADAAFMAGCDPAVDACLDAVGEQLGVQQLVIVGTRTQGAQVLVDVTATRRGAPPTRRTFTLADPPDETLAEIERMVPALLGQSAPVVNQPGGGAVPGGGGGTMYSTGDVQVRSSRPALAIAVGGTVLLAAGFTLWGLAGSTQGDIDDAPTDTPSDLDALAELEDRGATYAGLGNGLVLGGTITVAAGLTWLFIDRRRQQSRSLRFLPTAGAQQAGVAIGGTW